MFLFSLCFLQAERTAYTEGPCGICGEVEGPRYRHNSASIYGLMKVISSAYNLARAV